MVFTRDAQATRFPRYSLVKFDVHFVAYGARTMQLAAHTGKWKTTLESLLGTGLPSDSLYHKLKA